MGSPDSSCISPRLAGFGQSVFTEFTRLAREHDAINLGQGFPDFAGPAFVKQAAIEAIQAGHDQYAPPNGVPELGQAIAARFAEQTHIEIQPHINVTVTSGCTEAIAATMLGLLREGDEVIMFEPYYDSYPPAVAMSGGIARFVTLRPPRFEVPRDELSRAFSTRTRAILINTPHNPTGHVFSHDELAFIADLCVERDVIAITDEVYEHLVFSGRHVRMATLPGMWNRTITLSSLGKTFSLTGWKIGWAVAPASLTAAVRAAHQFITFSTATPLQHGGAAAIAATTSYYESFLAEYRARRDLLIDGLSRLGFQVFPPDGTYFVLADHTPFGFDDDMAFCRYLVTEVGVAAIPPSAFYHNPADGKSLVRFAFCKQEQTLRAALQRMSDRLK